MKTTSITGSISTGTMLADDLIPVFISVLEEVNAEKARLLEKEYEACEDGKDFDEELKSYILNDLFNALSDIAPNGYYFGAHEGDGADYGFWKCEVS